MVTLRHRKRRCGVLLIAVILIMSSLKFVKKMLKLVVFKTYNNCSSHIFRNKAI